MALGKSYLLIAIAFAIYCGFVYYLTTRLNDAGGHSGWSLLDGWTAPVTATIPAQNVIQTPKHYRKVQVNHPDYLSSCPTIQAFGLNFAMLSCTGKPDGWNKPFDAWSAQLYPSLRHFVLGTHDPTDAGYSNLLEVDLMRWAGNSRLRNMFVTPPEKPKAELAAEAMDWLKLESIAFQEVSAGGYAKHLGPLLTDLKEITLNNFCFNDRCDSRKTSQWLLTLPPLRKLTWLGGSETSPEILDPLLEYHGASLERLEIHGTGLNGPAPFISSPQLLKISQLAPNLRHLVVAIDRSDNWPYSAFEAIAAMTQLDTVDVYMEYLSEAGYNIEEYGTKHGDGSVEAADFEYQDNSPLFKKPLLDISGIKSLWRFVRGKSNGPMANINIYAGDFMRASNGPDSISEWYRRRQVSWACNERGCRNVEGDKFEYPTVLDERQNGPSGS